VFRLAFRMTGNEKDAEDVVQETFLKAYRSLERSAGQAEFSTWLHRIAANCFSIAEAALFPAFCASDALGEGPHQQEPRGTPEGIRAPSPSSKRS